MAVKPKNIINILRDRLIYSDVLTLASAPPTGGMPIFYDSGTYHYWQIEEVRFIPTVAYVGSQAVTISLGTVASATKFMNVVTLGTAAIAVGTPTANLFPTPPSPTLPYGTGVLPGATPLMLTWANNASQSGLGKVWIRLRPQEVKWTSTKSPQSALAVS